MDILVVSWSGKGEITHIQTDSAKESAVNSDEGHYSGAIYFARDRFSCIFIRFSAVVD